MSLLLLLPKTKEIVGQALALLEDEADLKEEINHFNSGDIGQMCFFDANLAVSTVEAAARGLVLVVPRKKLPTKLRQDLSFATRFNRAIAWIQLELSLPIARLRK